MSDLLPDGDDPRSRSGAPPSLWTAVITALFTVLLGIIGGLLTVADKLDETQVAAILVVLLGLVATATVGVIVVESAVRSKIERTRLDEFELLYRSTSRAVQFVSRTDVLRISDKEDAKLTWDFVLQGDEKVSTPHLNFPIYADLPKGLEKSWKPVIPKEVMVNDVRRDPEGSYKVSKRTVPAEGDEGPQQEHGRLAVPVDLEASRTSSRVHIVLAFKRVFELIDKGETFYVDIHHITRTLEVRIECDGRRVVQQPNVQLIEAMSALMEAPDIQESSVQSQRVEPVGHALVWKCKAPKVGYRYKINFSTESLDPPAADAPAGEAPAGPT